MSDIEYFDSDFKSYSDGLVKAIKRLPVLVGNEAVNFFKQSFDQQGFSGTTQTSWKKRKGNTDPGRAILVGKGSARLKKSIKRTSTAQSTRVIVGSDVEYAAVHNEGFNGTVGIPTHSRKKTKKVAKSVNIKTRRESRRKIKFTTGETEVKAHGRKMRMPKRQFMGNSPYLNRRIDRTIINELNKAT